MKYIINERQYRLLTKEEQEVLHILSLNVFGGWEALQKFLERRGNPLYSIGEDLSLRVMNVESLGSLTSVGGNLDLRRTNIKSLGNLTSVGGSLFLNGCENLTSLGNLTSVGGFLDLRGTNIESLGALTSVGGVLDLRGTPISRKYSREEIRQMIKVDGDIYL